MAVQTAFPDPWWRSVPGFEGTKDPSADAPARRESERLCNRALYVLILTFVVALVREIAAPERDGHMAGVRPVCKGIYCVCEVFARRIATVTGVGAEVVNTLSRESAGCRWNWTAALSCAHIDLALSGDCL